MKSKNLMYIYITAYLALLIPTPGRFVYGVTLMLELILLSLIGALSVSLVYKLKLQKISSLIIMSILISFTILYRSIFAILYSEIALVLGYIFYLPTISIFLLDNIFKNKDAILQVRLKKVIINVSVFSVIGLLFFLFRDIAGYGTFTFYGSRHKIYEKIILDTNKTGIFSFFASIPGALILAGLILFIYILFSRKFNILKNAEQQR